VNGDGAVDEADVYREWAANWKRVNAFQAEEDKRLTPADRLRQFFALLAMADKMGWETSTPAEVEEVRSRWQRLREAYLGNSRP
jgi:hypothetical protein